MAAGQVENRKVAIVGLEAITATEVYSLFVSGRIREVILVGAAAKRLIREFKELNAMVPLTAPVTLIEGSINDCISAGIAVVGGSTDAGCGTLVDLRKAVDEVQLAVQSLQAAGYSGIILVTGSPIELLVRAAVENSTFSHEKIFGIGNRTDLSSVVSRMSDRRRLPQAPPSVPSGSELPRGWCTAASSEVRYVDRCTPDCPFFESLVASPGVSKPFVEEDQRRSPQKLAACVTQICESVIDDLHTAAPVFVFSDGFVSPRTCVITREGLTNGVPDPAESGGRRDAAADAIWSMVNADTVVEARCA